MIEAITRWFVHLSQAGRLTVAISVMIGVTVVGVGAHAAVRPNRSTVNFCKVYSQEKARYIHATNGDDIGTGLSAVLAIPQLFDKLDKVAPAEIEPDVANIRDSLKKAEDAGGSVDLNDPLSGLASGLAGGLIAGLESAQSWENVSRFVDQNCPKTPEELAALKAQADKETLENAKTTVYNAVVALNGDVLNGPAGTNPHPLGLTSQLDSDLQTLKDTIAEQQKNASEPTTTQDDCENLRSIAKDAYEQLVADVKAVEAAGWPPKLDPDQTSARLRQDIASAQEAVAKLRSLGGDPDHETPN